ncbi:hypothetical protein RB195_014569 [Necator americanus]|uniref:Histone-lysine N-methyltransferase SETMAR n=1 Tax=Necator americanus TaxID=51031 RepID=A0ABR1E0R7_NECAM
MLCIWWSVCSVEYWELLAEGCTVTEDVYVEQHDNTQSHIGKMTEAEVKKFFWTILPHQPYSPDLAPSDYHLFSYLQRHVDGQDFQTCDDIKKALEQFFKELSPTFWSKGIYDLSKRWQKTIDANGAYFK